MRGQTLAALLLVDLAFPFWAVAAAVPDKGQRAYAAGQFEEARRIWSVQAEQGDAEAQLGLASLYDLGQGVARDAATAYRLYRRAAAAGLPAAEFNVAVMRDTGDGIARDAAEAALWYGRAAAHGNHRAQYNLGQLYAAGDGVPRNPDQSMQWFRAAATDLPAAAAKLAAMPQGGHARALPAGDESQDLKAVESVAPADGDTISRVQELPGAIDTVELVWVAPVQKVPVRFFVECLSLDSTKTQEVLATYSDATAILVPVEQVPGHYAWRVFTVSRSLMYYSAGKWNHFQVQARR